MFYPQVEYQQPMQFATLGNILGTLLNTNSPVTMTAARIMVDLHVLQATISTTLGGSPGL